MGKRTGLMVFLAIIGIAGACIADAAESWKVAYGGGRITGYVGLLANHGMPRDYLSDAELADPARLAEYRVVIVSGGVRNFQAISRAIAGFVENGGIAITEERIAPSSRVVPGERIGPNRAPNMDFREHDHPLSRSMHSAEIVRVHTQPGLAIVPKDADNVTVLATYTDRGVPERHREELTGGRKDLPAAMLIEHGEGQWLYFGPRVSFSLALRGYEMQPVMLEALRLLTNDTIIPRFENVDAESRLVPRVQWEPEPLQPLPRRAPRDQEQAAPPEGYEQFDLPEGAPADYVLTGMLSGDAEAEIMLPWFNEANHQRLVIDRSSLRLSEIRGERERVIAEASRPSTRGVAQVDIRRRPASVTVFIDRQVALLAPLNSTAGTPAAQGLDEAFLQPVAPVTFSDDFMRVEGDPSPWETHEGRWQVFEVEGEPEQGANPFAYQAEAGDGSATVTTGHWFWDDYDISCAVRPNAWTVALLAHFEAEDDHVALRVRMPDEGDATVQLVRVLPDGERVLASEQLESCHDSWRQLRLRLSGGHALVSVAGRDLFHVADASLHGSGGIGLKVIGGDAFFDDVRVQAWEALPHAADGTDLWAVERGRLRVDGQDLVLDPAGSLRAIAPTGDLSHLEAAAEVRRGEASWAGLLLRYQSPRDHYRVGLVENGDGSRLVLTRVRRGEETVLAGVPVRGGASDSHEIRAQLRGREISVWLDGRMVIETADDGLLEGGFAIAAEGGEAVMRNVTSWPVDHEVFRADPETPSHAGIIDLHTWAGAGSGWEPSPDDLDRYWHRGLYVGDVAVRLGVHRTSAGGAAASVMIGDGDDPDAGYLLAADQASPTEPVTVVLTREGEQVAAGETNAWAREGYALSLTRVGNLLVGQVAGETVCEFYDTSPLGGLRRVGFRRDGAIIDPADTEVLSSAVRTYTFEEAPVDWRIESGTWEVTNRWSCSPQWTWLAGWHQKGRAMIRSRWAVEGDQKTDIYVGARMMPRLDRDGHYEELRDLHFGLCGDGEGGGYHIIVGGNRNERSAILRNGETVVTNTDYRIPQAERHNNWLLVTLVKSGGTISVRVWDREIMRYDDPEPLDGGFVSFGTEENGITVPRITTYGRSVSDAFAGR